MSQDAEQARYGEFLFEHKDEKGTGPVLVALGAVFLLISVSMWTDLIHGTFKFKGGSVGIAAVFGPIASLLFFGMGIYRIVMPRVDTSFHENGIVQKKKNETVGMTFSEIASFEYTENPLDTGIIVRMKITGKNGQAMKFLGSFSRKNEQKVQQLAILRQFQAKAKSDKK